MPLTRENVRAFLDRDWELARRVKDEGLSLWIRERGTGAALRLSQALVDQAWPLLSKEERARNDVPGLLEMRRKLARAAP